MFADPRLVDFKRRLNAAMIRAGISPERAEIEVHRDRIINTLRLAKVGAALIREMRRHLGRDYLRTYGEAVLKAAGDR